MHPDRRHFPTDDLRAGAYESWELQTVDRDRGELGLAVGLVLTQVGAWWWTLLLRAERELVVVIDDEVPLPGWPHVEIRTTGLWAEIGINEPGEHVSVDLEAFGVQLGGAEEVFGAARGARTPVGLDVEWHRIGDSRPLAGGHVVPARVEGEILVADEQVELTATATGSWVHRFGVGSWPGPHLWEGSGLRRTVAEGGVAVGDWGWRSDLVRRVDGTLSWQSALRRGPVETPGG